MENKILCFDVESNGLYGTGFAVSAIVYDLNDDIILDRFDGMVEIEITDEFVINNVIDNLKNIRKVNSLEILRKEFIEFLDLHKGIKVIVDCGYPVDTNFLFKAISENKEYINISPYPLIDIASMLLSKGYTNDIDRFKLVNSKGLKHNPFCDALVAAQVYKLLIKD